MSKKELEDIRADIDSETAQVAPSAETVPAEDAPRETGETEPAHEATTPAVSPQLMRQAIGGAVALIGAAITSRVGVSPLRPDEISSMASAFDNLLSVYGFAFDNPYAVAWVGVVIAVGGAAMPRMQEIKAREARALSEPAADASAPAAAPASADYYDKLRGSQDLTKSQDPTNAPAPAV